MTVQTLIEQLKTYPSEMDVVVPSWKGFYVPITLEKKFMGSHQKESLVINPKL